jgi:hypothetical protein
MWRSIARAFGAGIVTAALLPVTAHPRDCLDVALVLALDASGSVDGAEYALETRGLAAALASKEVLSAIEGSGRVSISVVFWSDPVGPIVELEWVEMTDPHAAAVLGRRIMATGRQISGTTGLRRGINAALDRFTEPGLCARRRVINVSSDGRDSADERARGWASSAALQAKHRAEAAGVTVNALVIADGDPTLARYYAGSVITGPGAFVMEIRSHVDFAEAMRLKLLREIEPVLAGKNAPATTIALAATSP